MKTKLLLLNLVAVILATSSSVSLALSPQYDEAGFAIPVRSVNPTKPNSLVIQAPFGRPSTSTRSMIDSLKSKSLLTPVSSAAEEKTTSSASMSATLSGDSVFKDIRRVETKDYLLTWPTSLTSKAEASPDKVKATATRQMASETSSNKEVEEYKLKDGTTLRTEKYPSGRVDAYQYKGDPVGKDKEFPKPHSHSVSSADGTQHVYRTSDSKVVHNNEKHVARVEHNSSANKAERNAAAPVSAMVDQKETRGRQNGGAGGSSGGGSRPSMRSKGSEF